MSHSYRLILSLNNQLGATNQAKTASVGLDDYGGALLRCLKSKTTWTTTKKTHLKVHSWSLTGSILSSETTKKAGFGGQRGHLRYQLLPNVPKRSPGSPFAVASCVLGKLARDGCWFLERPKRSVLGNIFRSVTFWHELAGHRLSEARREEVCQWRQYP